jgi:hypothetical protein
VRWPAPEPASLRDSLTSDEALVEGFYNLKRGYAMYEGCGVFMTRDWSLEQLRGEARRTAEADRRNSATSAGKAVSKIRRKLDRLQQYFEEEAAR